MKKNIDNFKEMMEAAIASKYDFATVKTLVKEVVEEFEISYELVRDTFPCSISHNATKKDRQVTSCIYPNAWQNIYSRFEEANLNDFANNWNRIDSSSCETVLTSLEAILYASSWNSLLSTFTEAPTDGVYELIMNHAMMQIFGHLAYCVGIRDRMDANNEAHIVNICAWKKEELSA